MSFDDKRRTIIEAQKRVYKEELEHSMTKYLFCSRDANVAMLRLDFRPSELRPYPPFNKRHYFDVIMTLNDNPDALFKVFCAGYDDSLRHMFAMRPILQQGISDIPAF